MRLLALTLALALLLSACGGEGAESAPAIEAPGTSGSETNTPVSSIATPVPFDGPPAPDFALTLENRPGDFVLSTEPNPVYLVFWAEW